MTRLGARLRLGVRLLWTQGTLNSRDRRQGIPELLRTQENHQRRQMARPLAHTQLNGGKPSERNHSDTKRGEHDAHGHVRYGIGIHLPALELETSIIPRQQTS